MSSSRPLSSRHLSARPLGTAVLAVAVATVLAATPASAATGDLDPTWSGDGLATQTDGAFDAQATTLLADGRQVVAGTGFMPDSSVSQTGTTVSRYTPAGTLDTTWATGGVRKVNVAAGFEQVRDVLVDASGRTLVTGYVAAPDYPDETDVYVLRLDAKGAVDTTFGGGDGIVTIDRTNHDRGAALGLSGTRILVGASIDNGGNWGNQWTVFALTASGALDTTFSGDATAEVPVAKVGSFDSLRDLVVQPDGKIVLGGSSGTEFASARMTAAGALDPTYDGDGVARAVVEWGGAGYRLLLQPDKKLVLVGQAYGTGRNDLDMAAVRWNGNGSLDGSFSGDGKALVDVGGRVNDTALSGSLSPDGKIVLVGSTGGALDSATARLNWNGTLDTSFSGDGLVVTSTLATANEELAAVAVTPTGAVRAVGRNNNGWTLVGYSGSANTLLSVGDASVLEGRAGTTTTATFTVTLSAASPTPVTVKYATRAGTATSPADVTSRSGTLTFAPGVKTATIAVPVVGDGVREADETFTVALTLPTNAGIGDGTGVGTVRNDD